MIQSDQSRGTSYSESLFPNIVLLCRKLLEIEHE